MYSQGSAVLPHLWIQDSVYRLQPHPMERTDDSGSGVRAGEHIGERHFQSCLCNAVGMEERAPEARVMTPRFTS